MNRKILIGIGVVVVVAAGAFFMAKSHFDSEVRKGLEAFAASIPEPCSMKIGAIDVDSFSRTVTLHDTETVCSMQTGRQKFFTRRIVAAGVNVDAFKEGAGQTTLAKSLELTDSTFEGSGLNGSLEYYKAEGIAGDMKVILPALTRATPGLALAYGKLDDLETNRELRKQFMTAVVDLLRASETVVIDKVAMRNYAYTVKAGNTPMSVVLKESTSGRYSIRDFGPLRMTGISVGVGNAPVLSMESLSLDGMKLPSFVPLFEIAASGREPSPGDLQRLFKGKDFSLKNLRVKNMLAQHPAQNGRMICSLADGAFSYDAGAAHEMALSLADLAVNKDVYAAMTGFPPDVLALVPDVSHVDGGLTTKATPREQGLYDVAWSTEVREAALGAFSVKAEVDNIHAMAAMMGSPGMAALKSLTVTATDTGFSEIPLTLAAGKDGVTAAELRAAMLREMTAKRETLPNDTLKNVFAAVISFLEKPGSSITVNVNPETPADLATLQRWSVADPGKLGLSASVTPAR